MGELNSNLNRWFVITGYPDEDFKPIIIKTDIRISHSIELKELKTIIGKLICFNNSVVNLPELIDVEEIILIDNSTLLVKNLEKVKKITILDSSTLIASKLKDVEEIMLNDNNNIIVTPLLITNKN